MPSSINVENKADILELLFNSMPYSYVFWKNREGVYLGANTNQLKLFGHAARKNFIGKTIFQILQDYDSAKLINDTDNKIMQDGTSVILEEPVITPQGEKKVFLSQKQPIKNSNNETIGLLGFSLDITDRKKIEEELFITKEKAEAANQAKAEFLRNMEHQLRTPFCGIYTMVGMFAQSETDPEKKMGLEETSKSAKELLDLLNEIIDFSRNKTDKVPLLIKKFDLKDILEKAVIIEKPAAKVKKLTITYSYPNIPTIFLGDARCVQRIVLNLLDNAIKFTHSGEIKLEVKLAKEIDEKNLILQLVVSDTGIGIEKDKQQFIYEKFYRGHPANQNQYSGAGLGLYIVKELMDMLEGEIDVLSEPSKGSTFICTLSFKKPLLEELINTDL